MTLAVKVALKPNTTNHPSTPSATFLSNRVYRRSNTLWMSACQMCGQDRYIQNIHLCNSFQTATATAANTHGTHDNCISAKTVHNPLHEGGLSVCCLYIGCSTSPRKSF